MILNCPAHKELKFKIAQEDLKIFPYQDWTVRVVSEKHSTLLAVLGNKADAIEVAKLLGAEK